MAAVKKTRLTEEERAERKKVFLAELERTFSPTHAAREAKVARRTVFRWRKADKEFAEAWADALEAAVDNLEQSAYERALAGDTRLTQFLLKGNRSRKYAEKVRHEIRLEHVDVSDLNDEQLERIARGEDPSVVLGVVH